MSMLRMIVELPDNGAVELTGSYARYWKGANEEADYVGPIADLPWEVLRVLEGHGIIKAKG